MACRVTLKRKILRTRISRKLILMTRNLKIQSMKKLSWKNT
jgi:hypothetical protein